MPRGLRCLKICNLCLRIVKGTNFSTKNLYITVWSFLFIFFINLNPLHYMATKPIRLLDLTSSSQIYAKYRTRKHCFACVFILLNNIPIWNFIPINICIQRIPIIMLLSHSSPSIVDHSHSESDSISTTLSLDSTKILYIPSNLWPCMKSMIICKHVGFST